MRVAVVLDMQSKQFFKKIVGVYPSAEAAVENIIDHKHTLDEEVYEFAPNRILGRARNMDRNTLFGDSFIIIRAAADKETGAHKDLFMVALQEVKQ